MANYSIPNQLDRARRILSAVAGDEVLQVRLAQISYDTSALAEGQSLYDTCTRARTVVHARRGERISATAAVMILRRRVLHQYSTLAQICRVALAHNIEQLTALGLQPIRRSNSSDRSSASLAGDAAAATRPGRASLSQSVLLDRARILYEGALADTALLRALEPLGYKWQRLEAECADVHALEQADVRQKQHKAASTASTTAQREALAELHSWVMRFNGIVKPALRDEPELLGRLGLKARGGR